MVLRTSVIGQEIHKNVSFVEWAKSMKGQNVNGYINHYWNGVTSLQLAKICDQIIENDLYAEDVFHIHSNEKITKFQLLQMISDKFDLELTINEFETDEKCDRSLTSNKSLIDSIVIDSLEDQIENL